MALPFGLYRSPGATKRSLAFEKQRSEALDVAEPLVARSLRDAFKPPEQSALERFQRFERSDRLEFEPSRSPSGLFADRITEQPESVRQFETRFPGEDVPGTVPQPTVGFERLTADEQQTSFEGGFPLNLEAPARKAQHLWLRRAGQLTQEGLPVEEALSRAEAELGPAIQSVLTPEERGGIRGRLERGAGRLLNIAGKAGEAFQFATDPEQAVSAAGESLQRPSVTGQPTLEQQRRQAVFSTEIGTTAPPSFTEIHELGAEVSRPLVRPALQGVAEVVEQVEKPLGIEGVVSDKIRSQLAEDIATEVFNPVNIALAAPFAMQGTAGLTGVRLAEQIASNLLLTGLEPGLLRGTLRGFALLGTRGTAALKVIPKAIQETPTFQQALRGVREAGEAGGGRLAGEAGEEAAEAVAKGVPTEAPTPPTGPAAEETGNRFAAPLRDFDQVTSEVVTSENRVIQELTRGINPSVAQNTDEGRALTAYFRQRIAASELTDVAAAAALDPHAQRFTGRTGGLFAIADNGAIKGLRVKEGQSRIWQDVFSRPGDYALLPKQRAFIDDFRQVVDEVESLRVQAGLKPRAKAGAEGWGYVPRQVKGVRGTELRRPSSPGLQRVYEEAQEGVARGVRYDTNPRATLELHVRSAYREIADKQLSEALEPLSLTAKELVPEPVRIRMETAIANRKAVERGVRREIAQARKDLARPAATERQIGLRQRDLRKLESLQSEGAQRVAKARADFQKAKTAYSRAMDSARRAEIAPGKLFGRTEETIAIGQWRNRFFPREQADLLKEQLGTFLRTPLKANPFARGVEILGNHIRFLSAIGDFAAPFIQGLPLLARNPVAWSRAALRHYQAWFDPTVQARFIREHIETFQEMAQHGIPIGDPEFFAALREGGGISAGRLLEVLPKGAKVRSIFQQAGRQTFGRFQASYNMFLGSARAQMWEALKPSWRGGLDDLAAHIRNMTGGLDSRALGVGPNQRGIESVWLAFSPRLLRSTVALVSDLRLGLRNPKGLEAWRSLGSLVTGAVGVYVAAGLAQGKSEEEIRAGLNPLNGKRFLSFEVNGDWIGIGGQVRAITQFMAATGSAALPGGRPASDLISNDNPLLQFYQSRGAPALNIVGGAVEFATGGQANVLTFDNVDSLPDLVKHLGTSALPFALQGVLEGEGLLTTVAALAGARTSAQTPFEERRALVEQLAGKAEADLDPGERFDLFEGDERQAAARFGTDVDTIRQLRDLQQEGREVSGERFGSPFEERRESVTATATRIETEQLVPAAKGILAGDPLALDAYKRSRSEFFTSRSAVSESETARLGIEPSDFEATTKQQRLVDDYYALEPEDTNGNGFIDKEDMDAFFGEQDKLLARMDAGSKRAIKDPRNFFTDPDVIEVEELRLEAIDAIKAITALPKWTGLTLEEGEKLDDLVSRITAGVQRFKAQAAREGLDPDTVTFRSTAGWLESRGEITELDALNAIAVSSGKAIRDQGRIDLALDHRRELLTTFPNFIDTVLPVDVERQELTEEEIDQLQPVGAR